MAALQYAEFHFPREESIYQFLSTDPNGDQAKPNINAVGNYSPVSPGDFFISPPANELWVIERMMISIQASGLFRATGYGDSVSELANGIQILRTENGDVSDFLITTKPILHNSEWGQYSYDADVKTWGSGSTVLLCRWTFSKSGKPISLDGATGEKLVVRCRDDLSYLEEHYFHVQGFKINKL